MTAPISNSCILNSRSRSGIEMTQSPHMIGVLMRGRPRKAVLVRHRAAAILVTFMLGTTSWGQDLSTLYQPSRFVPPEVILIPVSFNSKTEANRWRLVYRNGLHGAHAPTLLTETRIVPSGAITWRITRTHNAPCVERTGSACPDMLQILSVPDGYIAVPDRVWVEEGDGVQVLIIPNQIG
jgi:hypothetical protein